VTVVSIRGLSKAYGPVEALRQVDLEIGPGVTGLLGPNGAGKSTLLLCVLGLLSGWKGEVRVLGLDARLERRSIRRRVGFMPEQDTYLPHMTGVRAVRFLGRLTGMPRTEALRRAHEVLFHVGLGEAVYRDVRDYSTGMRQRFKLAQALVHDPDLLFLDEPLSGMDPEGRDELLDLIRDLARIHGKHVVWSSHILPEVQKVADAAVVLRKGSSRGSFRLADLPGRDGRFEVVVEGDGLAFGRALAARGIEATRTDGRDGALAVKGRSTWVARIGNGGGETFLTLGLACDTRVRRITPIVETLDDVFHRLLGEPDADSPRAGPP
jgi:ABC-2 type transport system ATP-binding protein